MAGWDGEGQAPAEAILKMGKRRDHISNIGGTPEEIAAAGSRGGKASAASLTPEQRVLRARKAVLTRFGRGNSVVYEPKRQRHPEDRLPIQDRSTTERNSYLLRTDPGVLKAAKEKALRDGVSLRRVLGQLLKRWVAGEVNAVNPNCQPGQD